MKTSFRIIGLSPVLLFGGGASLSRTKQVPGTVLPGARLFASSFQLLAEAAGLPAADAVQGGAANEAGTKEAIGKIGRLLNAVTFAVFLSSGSPDCLIGGSAVSAAGRLSAVRRPTIVNLMGDQDRVGAESTPTGQAVALDVDNAIHAYLVGNTKEKQSLLHEGGNGSHGETFGSVAIDRAEDTKKGHQIKQVSRKLQASGLLSSGVACTKHSECQGKCKGDGGEDMKCREKLTDCKTYGHHSVKRWGCLYGWACAPNKELKWGSCTAAPTGAPTMAPSVSPTEAPTEAPTNGPTSTPSTSPIDTPSVPGMLRANVQCNPNRWLSTYSSISDGGASCAALVQSRSECSNHHFTYADPNKGGDGNCGCVQNTAEGWCEISSNQVPHGENGRVSIYVV